MPEQSILLAAHRGHHRTLPENSLAALKSALRLGVDYVELDVHQTADGQLVVIHDPTLGRTTTGSGWIREMTLAELGQIKLRRTPEGAVTGETIPTLDDYLARMDARTHLLLEVKGPHKDGHYEGIEARILALLRKHRRIERTLVISFDLEVLARMRALEPTIMLGGLLGYSEGQSAATLDVFMAHLQQVKAVFAGLQWPLLEETLLQRVHDAGMVLGVWTVSELEVLTWVLQTPVDIIISDDPELVKTYLQTAPSP